MLYVILLVSAFAVFLLVRQKIKDSKPRFFSSNTEVFDFAYNETDCNIKQGKYLIGVVLQAPNLQENAANTQKLMLLESPCAFLSVNILTEQGFFQNNHIPCTNLFATISVGDLIAVMPTDYNERLAFGETDPRKGWVFVAVATLQPIYKNKKEGWLVREKLL